MKLFCFIAGVVALGCAILEPSAYGITLEAKDLDTDTQKDTYLIGETIVVIAQATGQNADQAQITITSSPNVGTGSGTGSATLNVDTTGKKPGDITFTADAQGYNDATRTVKLVDMTFEFKKQLDSPEVRSYIPQGSKVQNGKIDLWSCVEIKGVEKNHDYGAVTSSRGNKDTFEPDTVNTNADGKFTTVLKTQEKAPALKVKVAGRESQDHNMLQALYKNGFHCTLYFTSMECGFTAAKGFTPAQLVLEDRTVDGQTVSAKKRFWERVRIEGSGRLENTQHNSDYVGYWNDAYHFISAPKGTSNIDLVPRLSCATDRDVIAFGWRIQTVNDHIQRVFGSATWRVDDVGGAIQGYDVDLYYGDAPPLSAQRPDIPETDPQFSDQDNVDVILTNIP